MKIHDKTILSQRDILFLTECSKAAFIIRKRLEEVQKIGKTHIFENDISALIGISSGLMLIADGGCDCAVCATDATPPEHN
jgi:hypothetical protein